MAVLSGYRWYHADWLDESLLWNVLLSPAEDGKWYWFDGAGRMVSSTWYWYKDHWYYLGSDGAMCVGQITVDGKWYVMDAEGRMITEPVTLTPDQDGALQWPGLAE